MSRWTKINGVMGLFAAALLAAGCSEATGPKHRSSADASPGTPAFATTAAPSTGIAIDQFIGTFNEGGGPLLIKGFNNGNPHHGDALVATFFWLGSTDMIDSVADVLTTGGAYTPVGNKYTRVEFVTSGGISMATYVATNIQGYPDPFLTSSDVLAVAAYLKQPVLDGGVLLSAWSGVNAVSADAVGAHSQSSGSGSAITVADPGPIMVGDGALAYNVTMSGALVPREPPGPPFTNLTVLTDASMLGEVDYAMHSGVGTVDPVITWYFNSPSTWLTNTLVLNPPLHLGFSAQPQTTMPLLTMPAVQVTVLNALGTRATTFNGQVTIAIGRNGSVNPLVPGTLSGTKTVTAINGVATFSDLSIDQPGNGYTLVVSGLRLTGAESTPFNIGL